MEDLLTKQFNWIDLGIAALFLLLIYFLLQFLQRIISRAGFLRNLRFTIRDESNEELVCRYSGVLPDPFAEGRVVILQGGLAADRVLDVTQVTVKCPSKYEEEGYSEEEYQDYYGSKYRNGHPGSTDGNVAP